MCKLLCPESLIKQRVLDVSPLVALKLDTPIIAMDTTRRPEQPNLRQAYRKFQLFLYIGIPLAKISRSGYSTLDFFIWERTLVLNL